MSPLEGSVKKVNSHQYILNEFTVGPKGLVLADKRELKIVRGSTVIAENVVEKQDGILVEQLLEVSAEYLRSVNVGEMRSRETSSAITKIEEALMWMKKRTDDRAGRGVLGTYEK